MATNNGEIPSSSTAVQAVKSDSLDMTASKQIPQLALVPDSSPQALLPQLTIPLTQQLIPSIDHQTTVLSNQQLTSAVNNQQLTTVSKNQQLIKTTKSQQQSTSSNLQQLTSNNDSHQLTTADNNNQLITAMKPKVTFDDLASQERRTRIAFLENQQAELETEIRLLKQNGNSNAFLE